MDWFVPDFTESIEAAERGDRAAGEGACERLLSDVRWLPEEIELWTRRNQTWYLPVLAGVGNENFRQPPYTYAHEIMFWAPTGWSRFNPSIADDGRGKLKIIIRSANYHIERSGRYTIHDEDGVIRTQNWIADIEPDGDGWCLGSVATIDTDDFKKTQLPFMVQGFEDARLFYATGTWQFSATVRDRHPDGLCQIARCSLDGIAVSTMNIQPGPIPGRHEKNWMPIPQSQSYVYQVGCPTMTVDHSRGGHFARAPHITRSFRGGSVARIGPGNELLAIVHESVDFPEGTVPRRVYQHRFVRMVNGIDVRGISRPFCFEGRGIEFAAGMVLLGDDLVISYGVNDAKAKLMRLPLKKALSMLSAPLPEDACESVA